MELPQMGATRDGIGDGMLCFLLPSQHQAASQPAGSADGMPWLQALTLDEYEAKQKKA